MLKGGGKPFPVVRQRKKVSLSCAEGQRQGGSLAVKGKEQLLARAEGFTKSCPRGGKIGYTAGEGGKKRGGDVARTGLIKNEAKKGGRGRGEAILWALRTEAFLAQGR